MMDIDIITIFPGMFQGFPGMFQGFLQEGLVARAQKAGGGEGGGDGRGRGRWGARGRTRGASPRGGGEVAALAIVEAVVRLLPGALGSPQSLEEESHSSGLLEYPQYTRPPVFRGWAVPPILLSGNHQEIARWRRE